MRFFALATNSIINKTADSWHIAYKSWPEENSIIIFITHSATTDPADLAIVEWSELLNALPKPDQIIFSETCGQFHYDIHDKSWK